MNAIAAVTMLLLVGGGTAIAQETRGAGGEGAGQSLDQAASDPTASLLAVQVQNIYAGDCHPLDGETGNTVLLRAAVPFKTGDLNHIARITLPVVTNSPSRDSGLGDIVLFDLLAFDESWGRWGVGPVLLTPTASDDSLGADKWAIGPALGFVARAPGAGFSTAQRASTSASTSASAPTSSARSRSAAASSMRRTSMRARAATAIRPASTR